MAKANITQYSSTPSSNTDINNINIDENCPASGLNNAIRELMAHLKNVDTGSQALTALSVTGDLTVDTSTLKVDSTNNRVGISNASPSTPLDVGGHIRVTGGDDCDIEFQLGSARRKFIGGDGNELELGTYSSSNTSRDIHARMTSAGQFLIGRSATSGVADGHRFDANGFTQHVRDGDSVLEVARESSDGAILIIKKDTNEAGRLGSVNTSSASRLFIANGNAGVHFNGGTQQVIPCNSTGAKQDNSIDLGNLTGRYDDVYATNGNINTSDRNEKQDIEELSEAEQRVAVACKGLLRKYRWKDKVAEKGDNARIHFGIIAQDLQDAFTAEGLDAGDYAMFISNTWWEKEISVDAVEADEENGIEAQDAYTYMDEKEEATEGYTERTRLGVRYNQLLAFIISAL